MRVSREVLAAIAAHARRESPRECCGLLIGDDSRITEAVPTPNVAADPARRYEIAPADFLQQIRRCRAREADGGPAVAVIGAYHSHPRTAPEPSPTDRQEAFENFLFLIGGPVAGGDPWAIRAYRLVGGNLQPVPLVPEAQEGHR